MNSELKSHATVLIRGTTKISMRECFLPRWTRTSAGRRRSEAIDGRSSFLISSFQVYSLHLPQALCTKEVRIFEERSPRIYCKSKRSLLMMLLLPVTITCHSIYHDCFSGRGGLYFDSFNVGCSKTSLQSNLDMRNLMYSNCVLGAPYQIVHSDKESVQKSDQVDTHSNKRRCRLIVKSFNYQ